ncbi:hypothetical protein ALP72_102113 [Pseudomonas coronafaciens pv. coronafaciens]|nr:hypothetical protein ALP72_102113 [Pseudomonas coronafaciens pv. coronafaciens]RMW06138.1 hypothetical protein ALP00_102557 [Pseudomonas coronafaciens pv. porri]
MAITLCRRSGFLCCWVYTHARSPARRCSPRSRRHRGRGGNRRFSRSGLWADSFIRPGVAACR